MSKSLMATLNNARNLKGQALADMYIDAFKADSMHLVNANNEGALIDGMQSLKINKAGKLSGDESKGLGQAMAEAVKAIKGALPDGKGWMGAVNGPFAKAEKEKRAPYLLAHACGVEVFTEALKTLAVFPEPVTKTDEEKARAKAEKAEKAAKAEAEALASVKKALIESGEFIAKADIVTIDKLSALALTEALLKLAPQGFSQQVKEMLNVALMVSAGQLSSAEADKLTA